MHHASPRALVAAALAAALWTGAPARAQDAAAPAQIGVSTGYNLLPQALSLIEATRAGVAFEAVHDSRFRVVRHMATGFACAFLPTSEAVVAVVAPRDGAQPGEDSVCLESIDGTDVAYRIARFPGVSLDQAFADARTAAGGWLTGEASEVEAAPPLAASPHQPDVAVDMPRRQILLVGDSAQGPAMLRIAVAQLDDGWFVTQNYFAPIPNVTEEEIPRIVVFGSALAEAAFVVRLSEQKSPTRDPALAPP